MAIERTEERLADVRFIVLSALYMTKNERQVLGPRVTDVVRKGETMPRAIGSGDAVYAGTLNLSGALVTQATATDQNTLLAEIGRLMSTAEQARGRYVRLADRAAHGASVLGQLDGWPGRGAGCAVGADQLGAVEAEGGLVLLGVSAELVRAREPQDAVLCGDRG